MASPTQPDPYDVAVIGTGFGGMSAALELARTGARVALFETLKYPGGCASTFTRRGRRFESGATLFSGFGEGQLFRRWIDELQLDVDVELLDPLVELRAGSLNLRVAATRAGVVDQFAAMPGANPDSVRRFFDFQRQIADTLWALFDDPTLIPPFGLSELLRHVGRTPRYLSLVPLVGRPLATVLRKFGLDDFTPLRTYLNAVCQITVQANVDEAEAPFALAAMDYYFRGTGHVEGGIGHLGWELVRAFERAGGDLFMADQVASLRQHENHWAVKSRRREVRANVVVANLMPATVMRLTEQESSTLRRLDRATRDGWGAAMLYLVMDGNVPAPPGAHHLELVDDESADFVEGNHVFVSIGALNETAPGERGATVSTHIDMRRFLPMDDEARAAHIGRVQARMRRTLAARAPELLPHITLEMPASPRTFERFTGRPNGCVGGIPRRAGLNNYRDFLPSPMLKNLFLVGDTVFPGQSTLATAIGGLKVAQRILR